MQDTWVIFDNIFSTADNSSLFIRRLGDNNTYGSIYDHLFKKNAAMLTGHKGEREEIIELKHHILYELITEDKSILK